jgi:hypothetical protein
MLHAVEIGADVMELAAGMDIFVDASSSWTCVRFLTPWKWVPMWWK